MEYNTVEELNLSQSIIESKTISKEYSEDQKYIIDEKILVGSSEEIKEKSTEIYHTLLGSTIKEDGGRNALFGFYYQFLVAVDYLIELGEGKWDFLALEIHDDIILGKENGEESKVRFVQVKTSKQPTLNYTSTELCKRSKKKFEEGETKIEKRINDCWLDKLFSNAEMFKNDTNIKQEFQLVTNFSFYFSPSNNSKTRNINHYRRNELFSEIEINDDDPFLKKMIECVYDPKGVEYSYQDRVGMGVEELLRKTQISERPEHLVSYRDGVIKRLGEFLSKKIGAIGGATILDEDVNWLIGEMCSKCAAREDNLVLFINKTKADEIIFNLMQKSKVYSEQFNEIIGNKKYINEAFNRLIIDIKNNNSKILEDIEQVANSTKNMIDEWIINGGDILQLIGRFNSGRVENLSFHNSMHKSEREEYVFSLVMISVLLKIIHEDTKISMKYKSLLGKEITTTTEKYDVSLIKMPNYYLYREITEKLNKIITRMHMEKHEDILTLLLNQPHRIIFDGIHDTGDDNSFNKGILETISLPHPENFTVLDEEDSMSKVDYKFLFIPWYILNSKYERFKRDEKEYKEIKASITDIWNGISKVEGEL